MDKPTGIDDRRSERDYLITWTDLIGIVIVMALVLYILSEIDKCSKRGR